MSGPPRENLQTHTAGEEEEKQEVYLRDGRKLVLKEQGGDQLVEIRSESGLVEVRIRLTEEGPVLQMESARLSLKATEAVEIESKRVEIKSSEEMTLTAGGDLVAIGKIIHLNPDKE
jgi:phage gp45-like